MKDVSESDVFQAYKNYLMLVGDIATHYAAFEYVINETIWELCDLDERRGACITSEIISHAPRFRILIALMYERKCSEKIIERANEIASNARKTTLFRNKYVHTPLNLAVVKGILIPMNKHIKIEKILKNELKEYDYEEMTKTSQRCQELTNNAKALRADVQNNLEKQE